MDICIVSNGKVTVQGVEPIDENQGDKKLHTPTRLTKLIFNFFDWEYTRVTRPVVGPRMDVLRR